MSTGGYAMYAKLLCRYGKRLTAQNYKELIIQPTVQDVTSYLKTNTKYTKTLKDLNDDNVARATTELFLNRHLFDEMAELCRFDRSIGDKFFELLILENEVNELMSFLRYYNAKKPTKYIFYIPDFFKAHSDIDFIGLTQTKSFNEVLECVHNDKFTNILHEFAPNNSQSDDPIDYAAVGSAFDKYYFETVLSFISINFSGMAKDELISVYKLECEMNNIRRIFRAKRYFNATTADIKSLIVPIKYRISDENMDRLIAADTEGDVISILKQTVYGRMFESRDFTDIDSFTNGIIFDRCRRLMHQSINPPVTMCMTIKLNRFEIHDLINIIEGVRYKLPANKIEDLLVTTLSNK